MELKTKTFVFILVSFVLGGLAGGFIGRTYFPSVPTAHRPTRAEIQKQFAERLKLTATQATQVDSIFEAYRVKFGTVQKSYRQAFRSQHDTLRMAIRAVLGDEQNKLYDEFLKEMDGRESRRREGFDRR